MLDEQKIQSHLIAMKAAAHNMLEEAEKVEQMLQFKPSKKKVEVDRKRALMQYNYEKRFQRRLKR